MSRIRPGLCRMTTDGWWGHVEMESPLIGWPEIDLITKDGWSPFHFPIKSDQKKREKEKKDQLSFLFCWSWRTRFYYYYFFYEMRNTSSKWTHVSSSFHWWSFTGSQVWANDSRFVESRFSLLEIKVQSRPLSKRPVSLSKLVFSWCGRVRWKTRGGLSRIDFK